MTRDAPVYFLASHEPYRHERDTEPVNCVLVEARTLLHPSLPQPDAGHMYRCVVEAPDRRPGEIVPLSTLTFELGGGRLWDEVADWEAVRDALVDLTVRNGCDSMRFGLSHTQLVSLVNGPQTINYLYDPGGGTPAVGPEQRRAALDELAGHIRAVVADGGPFWCGDGLIDPPAEPTRMPYEPDR